ncbi:MAG: hypothetical protein KGN35_08880, partial [Betaproteobacteria bacterium]|nr:hypothetical protein [Betaproteobacteria bacterium]
KKDDLHWKWTTINKFSGNLGNIRLVELYIPNSNSCFSTPWIAMTIKEESPFEEKESVTYYPTNPYVTNQNRVKTSYARNVTLKFNSLDKAKSFQKAFTHAANLCSKQEKPKNSLF